MARSDAVRPRAALCAGALLALAACEAEDCGDPRSDGLFTAAGCVIGPGYQQQTDQLAQQAAERQSLANALAAENQRLNARLATLRGEERAATSRLIALNTSLGALDRDLSNRRAQARISQAEYDLVAAELRSLEAQRAQVAPADPGAQAQIAALEAQIADLRAVLG